LRARFCPGVGYSVLTLGPVALQLLGHELGEAGQRALPHLGAGDADHHVSSGWTTTQALTSGGRLAARHGLGEGVTRKPSEKPSRGRCPRNSRETLSEVWIGHVHDVGPPPSPAPWPAAWIARGPW
jgi:hypothetical protein